MKKSELYRAARIGSRGAIAVAVASLITGCSQPLGYSPGGDPLAPPGVPPSLPRSANFDPRASSRHLQDDNPNVTRGLEVAPAGRWALKVDSGACSIDGRSVTIPAPVVLDEVPVPSVPVVGERAVLTDDPPRSFDHGTRLKGLISDVTTLPGALDPASLKVWSAAAPPRTAYLPGVDYLVSPEWGEISRKPGGHITAGQPVFVDYRVRQLRLDTVEVTDAGKVELKRGTPSVTAPSPAAVDTGCLPLTHVFLSYGADRLDRSAVFPIGPAFPPPTEAERKAMELSVARTRARLQSNGKVTIVFWGDSVTAGGSASTPAKRFPDLVAAGLREEFKGATVNLVNAGIGGSNIDERLPSLQNDVLSHHPDLVVVEFVNDMGLSPATIRKDYTQAIRELKASGSEVILTTPHFTMPEMMKIRTLHDRDPRPGVAVLREVAREQNVGLADVSRRWEHLAVEGTPYVALLYNGINHPDDRGHEIYAKSIEAFF